MFDEAPLNKRLSGLPLEYRVLELFSRDSGNREAKLAFDVGQGTQDIGFRSEANLLFECHPCVPVKLNVLDDDGSPTTANFTIRDARNRVYPARSRRLASEHHAFAMATSMSAESSSSLVAQAALYMMKRMPSTSVTMSAALCWIAWNEPMGRPNWTRSLA